MSTTPSDRLLTPTKITAWLDCAHYLTLQRAVDEGTLQRSGGGFGAFAQLVAAKGVAHEQACLEELRTMGVAIHEPPPRSPREPFDEWVARVGNPLDATIDVVYQMPFVHDGVRGVADFVLRVTGPDTGIDRWEPMDAKLARVAAKPGHVLQLCFYAEAIAALTGTEPATLRLWLGSGEREEIDAASVMPYWRRLRSQLTRLVATGPDEATTPVPCTHCDYCDYADHCEHEWRSADALHYVAGLHTPDVATLDAGAGISTLAELARTPAGTPVPGLRAERLERLVTQASLQVEARADDTVPPPFRLIEPGPNPPWGYGFDALPEPSRNDVYLDFEGDPLWRASRGLFFLFGYLARDDAGTWQFHALWGHDIDSEAASADALVAELARRRAADPTMHAYHYNHTERHALLDLATMPAEVETLIESGLFVDLYAVARNAVQVGTESYGLKHLERLAGFERTEDIHGGAGAVVEYEAYLDDGDPDHLHHIARYNEDDVRATLALHEWLLAQRPADLPWRDAHLDPEDTFEELDELVAALHAFDDDSDEHLLGDVMGYWFREWRAHKGPIVAKLENNDPDLVDDPSVITGLVDQGLGPRIGAGGKTLPGQARTFTFPAQEIADDLAEKKKTSLYYSAGDGLTGYSSVDRIDPDAGELVIKWSERAEEIGAVPAAVALNDWVRPNPKHLRLNEIGWRFVDAATHGDPPPAARALLHRAAPTFTTGNGPADGRFGEDLDEMKALVGHLDGSCLAIQGPPGTGKTFRGAHIVHQLVLAGKRVGITAFSHHAIDNLLAEVVEVFRSEGDLDRLDVVRKVSKKPVGGLPRVTYETDNKKCAKAEHNVVAGTTWLFANDDIIDNPVDVLIIDEAGQLSLTDALSTTLATTNVILLGDPQQLPQVSQASHPNGSGASVLEHLLGDERTISAERGIFLPETRRMHPDVCRFISDQFYEGRLSSHESCSTQSTSLGTGLRWLPAVHDGCSTSSEVEAQLVADELGRLIGTPWTDHHGREALLTSADVMVVAPYNDQVNLLREVLGRDDRTRGTRVGTVDKFQGQQAPVVMFSMATSSAAEMPRTADFLFSRNRLNVAISRARCLAYVVCTEQLLDSRARTVEDMQLISTLCAFAEYAG